MVNGRDQRLIHVTKYNQWHRFEDAGHRYLFMVNGCLQSFSERVRIFGERENDDRGHDEQRDAERGEAGEAKGS